MGLFFLFGFFGLVWLLCSRLVLGVATNRKRLASKKKEKQHEERRRQRKKNAPIKRNIINCNWLWRVPPPPPPPPSIASSPFWIFFCVFLRLTSFVDATASAWRDQRRRPMSRRHGNGGVGVGGGSGSGRGQAHQGPPNMQMSTCSL